MQVDSFAYFSAAFLLLVLPLDWFLSAVAASFVHELCHIATLYLLHGKITGIHIRVSGCMLETDRIAEMKQFFSILAGPAGSFLLLFLSRVAPKIAICGLIQGIYNLIPVLPLDGGRLFQLLLFHFFPGRAEMILDMTAIVVCVLISIFASWLSAAVYQEIWPMVFALIWSSKVLPGKTPCKPLRF